jgi:hypothetical protein
MSSLTGPVQVSEKSADLQALCSMWLCRTQNQDGGWGHFPGRESRVESTSWAVLALSQTQRPVPDPVARACEWLRGAQLPDGSWPAAANGGTGSWVTSLAALALFSVTGKDSLSNRAIDWICADLPKDGTRMRRFMTKILGRMEVSRQNPAYQGWGWTPRTASWVEPTSYALIFLRSSRLKNANIDKRYQLAVKMLYDRMCPGGGWNAGNPVVYGSAGRAHIGPTVWALFALQESSTRPEYQQGLMWLRQAVASCQGPTSLALAQMYFRAFGHADDVGQRLGQSFGSNKLLEDTLGYAWALLASCGVPGCFLFAGTESQ